MEIQKHEHNHQNEDPDSIELSTPAKGGAIKIYGNFLDPDRFRAKIKDAIEIRKWAQKLMEE